MSVELARVRLRGYYAIAAALILLVALPIYQAAVLGPTGYGDAVQAILQHGTFEPYLAWLGAHGTENRASRFIQIVAFVLAATLPHPLRRVLWPSDPREGRLAAFLGQIGFGLFAAALVLGLFSSTGAASAYGSAGDATQRASIAHDFTTSFALETLISRVLGGALVATALVMFGLRIRQTRTLPVWLAYATLAVAALEAATALLSALTPAEPQVATSGLTVVALALWLAVTGFLLTRLRTFDETDAPADSGESARQVESNAAPPAISHKDE